MQQESRRYDDFAAVLRQRGQGRAVDKIAPAAEPIVLRSCELMSTTHYDVNENPDFDMNQHRIFALEEWSEDVDRLVAGIRRSRRIFVIRRQQLKLEFQREYNLVKLRKGRRLSSFIDAYIFHVVDVLTFCCASTLVKDGVLFFISSCLSIYRLPGQRIN